MTVFGKFGVAVLAAMGFAAGGCAPSIVPTAKADIDRRIAALGSPAKIFDASSEAAGIPLEPGQWVQYRVRDDEGHGGGAFFAALRIAGKTKELVAFGTSGARSEL